MRPRCHANPSKKRLLAIESPMSRVAICVACKNSLSGRVCLAIERRSGDAARSMLPSVTNAAVGVTSSFTTPVVRCTDKREIIPSLPATTRSHANSKSVAPTPMRPEPSRRFSSARRIWLDTLPFFWASPVLSRTVTNLPSRCAAMPINAPTVTTPVPPIPVTRILNVPLIGGMSG